MTEQQFHDQLVKYYEKAGGYDGEVASCADDFNANYLKEDLSLRKNKAAKASSLKQKIKSDWDALKNLKPPFSSNNKQAYDDICLLYEYLWRRIDVIDRAWAISLGYEKPAEHKDEILQPIGAEREGGNNKYYTMFKNLYPKVEIQQPQETSKGLEATIPRGTT